MACGMYTRVRLDTSPLKMYGFQKVTSDELHDITTRIVKPTYNREVYVSDRHRPAPTRVPSARCKKSTGDVIPSRGGGRLPGPLVEKIFKRMRTPTLSLLAAQGEIQPSYELVLMSSKPRPKSAASATEKDKSHESYSRPTTASNGRRFCRFCTDPALKGYMEIDYSDDKEVEEEELSGIIQRLTTPTMASRLAGGGQQQDGAVTRCPRRKQSTADAGTRKKQQLPLVSGLSRSRSVHEISHRLYSTPTQAIPTSASSKKDRRQKLAATPCTM